MDETVLPIGAALASAVDTPNEQFIDAARRDQPPSVVPAGTHRLTASGRASARHSARTDPAEESGRKS
jgi:hypothetical protein